jgi:hypothetical protein
MRAISIVFLSKMRYNKNMKILYPQTNITPRMGRISQPQSESWKRAIGVLQHKQINSLIYQKKVRREWEKRLNRQTASATRNGN